MTDCTRQGLKTMACVGLFLLAYGIYFIADLWLFDLRALEFVTSAPRQEEVRDFFARRRKRPVERVVEGARFEYKGWAVPNRMVSGEAEAYDLSFGLRVYVYYDKNGEVEYVFTSQS